MISWLDPRLPPEFPDTDQALRDPNGLLAAGGLLNASWLITAYRRGIFPWFNENEPILWWTPAPRTVLFPEEFRINRSFRKFLKKSPYHVTCNQRFTEVMEACAEPRPGQPGSWISPAMVKAYRELFELGYAKSYECWNADNVMVGGLYGVALGQVFFGESMFSRADYASRVCLHTLIESGGYKLIDCQMTSAHLISLGAREIDRDEFEQLLQIYIGDLGSLEMTLKLTS
jgi:leucyl/phenylalanyl-tRNA--protein transferase